MANHTILVSAFIALLTIYIGSAGMSFVGGQRLLTELRVRFPSACIANGEPSYLAVGAVGRRFWRTVAASNFFTDRRYEAVPDAGFISRAERVRGWQTVSEYAKWSVCGVAVIGAFVFR